MKSFISIHLTVKLCLIVLLVMIPVQTTAEESDQENFRGTESFAANLNLRLSNRPLTPPDNLIAQAIPLKGLMVAQAFVAPSPQAVIFEDDQRQRIAVLSQDEAEHLTLFLLEPLSLDPALPGLLQCADHRNCQTDRTPMTGGLGCLAFCLKEILESAMTSPTFQ